MPDPTNPTPAADPTVAAAAALDAAIAGEAMPDLPEPAPAPDPDVTTTTTPDTVDELGLPTTADPAGPDTTTTPDAPAPDPAKPEPTPEEKAAAEHKADIDQQVAALKAEMKAEGKELGPKGEQRFRDAAEYKRTTAPIVAELEKVGVKSAADVVALVSASKTGEELFERVRVTGVSPDQYLNLLDYGAVNVKSEAGDAKAGEQCAQFLAAELVRVCRLHGFDLPQLEDPLAAHKDLVAKVEDGLLTREAALEVAQGRAATARATAATDAQRQQQDAAAQRTQAIEGGRTQLRTVSAELYGTTPESQAAYKRLEPQLVAAIPGITAKFKPDQWGVALRQVFDVLVKLPAVPPTPTPKPGTPAGRVGPSRSSGPTPPLAAAHATPEQALDAALAFEANQGG